MTGKTSPTGVGKGTNKRRGGRQKSATRKRSLTEDLKRQAKVQRVLYEIADAASAVTDTLSFYKRMHDIVRELMYAENFFIATYDEQTKLLSFPYFADVVEKQPPTQPLADFHGMTSWVIRTGETAHHGWDHSNALLAAGEIASPDVGTPNEDGIAVPLTAEGKTIGALFVQSYTKGIEYTDQDERVLEFVAQHIATALTRVRSMEETRQRNFELRIINSIQDGLAAQLDFQAIIDVVGNQLREVFSTDSLAICLTNPETRLTDFPFVVSRGERVSVQSLPLGGITGTILRIGKTLVFNRNFMAEAIQKYDSELLVQGPPPKSGVYVPITAAAATVGVLVAANFDHEEAYPDSAVRLLEIVAGHMGTALENARLFEETQQRNAELNIINSVQAALAAQLDIRGIYDVVGDKLRGIFSNQDVSIYSADLKAGRMTIEYSFEKGRKFEPLTVPMNSLYEYVVTSNATLVFNGDAEQFAAQFKDYQVPSGAFPKSLLGVPVRRNRDEDPVTYLTLQDVDGKKVFSDSDVRLLQTIADSMGAALENVRLFAETQRLLRETEQRNSELAIINGIQDALASKLEMQDIYDLVGDRIRDIFHDADMAIRTYDPATNLVHWPYAYENGERITVQPSPLPERGFVAEVLRTRKTLVINEEMLKVAERYGSLVLPGLHMEKSAVHVPLVVAGQARGLITLADMEREHAFSESDVRLLETLADSMSIALENARLWEQEKLFRKALQRELEIGREIQAGFLPESLPQAEGWEIAASLLPAREVAGDFYDAFELPDGKIGLVIADVCDKGVGAALFMTLFRSLIRVTTRQEYTMEKRESDGSDTATRTIKNAINLTNNYIAETHEGSGMFATLFFGILDPHNGELTYINGGHEPPLVLQGGRVREILAKTGPAVGAIPNGIFDVARAQLCAGDVFFACTDGVPDCLNPQGEFFGRDRLLDTLQERSGSPDELVAALETELHTHIDRATQFDDITLLAVRRK